MRQGFVRVVVVLALAVVAGAPGATAGATGDGAPAGPPAAPAGTPPSAHRPPTWSEIAGRLRQQGRLHRADTDQGSPAGRAVAAAPVVAPALTVTPASGLVAGQQVTVAGSGFPSGQYALAECAAGAASSTECDTNLIDVIEPDAAGGFSSVFNVRRTLRLFGGPLDCASVAGACEIEVIDFRTAAFTAIARATLSFDATAPLPDPSITVSPATNLRDRQSVTVAGTRFAPNSFVALTECVTGSVVCGLFVGGSLVQVAADGTFSSSVSLSLRINDDFGGLTNCVATACEIQATSYDAPDYSASAPLAFDPSQPIPPPPVLTVTPHTGLHHDQSVQVHGTGFDPSAELEVTECPAGVTGSCDEYLTDLQTAADGSFDATVTVSRLVAAFDPSSDESTTVDCATGGCTISATEYSQRVSLVASAPISFDTTVPPPPIPTITVTPHSGLPYRATVSIHGEHFRPGESVFAYSCMSGNSLGFCGVSQSFGTAAADGTVDLTLAVRRRITLTDFPGGSQTIDCVDATTLCSVEVDGARSYERVVTPISFDPNAPVPPPPTATITPDHDLPYRQTVTLDGSNFEPGPIPVSECVQSGGPIGLCAGFTTLTADASGHVHGDVAVTRLLSFGGPGALAADCVTVTCVLDVGDTGFGDVVTVPLPFDPNAPVPPPPSITVTPSTRVFDGEHVTVAGQHFTPGSRVGITECRAGVTVIAEGCDIERVHAATVAADGTFSTRFVTASVLGPSVSPFDCTRTATSCVIAAANAPTLPDFATAPIAFSPPDLSVMGVGVREGTGGMTMAPVHVELSKPDRNPITVHWVAQAITASPGTDYTSVTGSITIPAGATEAMIDTMVVADRMDEPTETFRVRVVDAPGTRIVDRVGTVTIHDDDAAPSVSVHDTRRREDHGEAHAEVVLSAASGRTVIVHYVTHHATARAGSDYVRKDSRLVFRPGETRHLVRVVLVNDRVHEPTETFRVELDRVEQATVARGVATVTITDDD
jgi:hypothetical protein